MLDQEIQYFEANRHDLLRQYPGKFIVLKEQRLLGPYESIQEALGAGVAEFGITSFLVRRTDQPVENITIPALTLGLLRADPSHTTSGTSSDS